MSEWISVKDRLPEKLKTVLIHHHGSRIETDGCAITQITPYRLGYLYDSFSGDLWMIECRLSGSCYTAKDVHYWMPIPPPPTK